MTEAPVDDEGGGDDDVVISSNSSCPCVLPSLCTKSTHTRPTLAADAGSMCRSAEPMGSSRPRSRSVTSTVTVVSASCQSSDEVKSKVAFWALGTTALSSEKSTRPEASLASMVR